MRKTLKRLKRTGFTLLIVTCANVFADDLLSEKLMTEDVVLEGVFAQGGLLKGNVKPSYDVKLNEREIRLTREGDFIIGFGRDAAPEHKLTFSAPNGERHSLIIDVKQRTYPTQSIKGVPQKTVTPSKDKLARIKRETALVKNARKTDSSLLYFLDDFTAPMRAPITGVYGSQRIYNGTPKRPHYGVDYAGPVGAPVYAPASGKVTLVHEDMFYSGGTLIVDHGYGLSSTFIHLSEVVVKEGEDIVAGQEIAKVGAGGRSTGPHLDWRVNWYGTRIDPQLVLLIAGDK
ncbi:MULTISPECIES: M23 family metallopeptidase [unclassified Oleiphilus]|jgi:murein DD-endopeptidase MepM/ murein hydrolase activator NlpD|uniref:M23 family metallopeptidase n=3 Tax=Oleiphilus TaxID=141450 RepID=UPI0009EE1477|nr:MULTISPECIES: M23 family metallopeptidase [unclassified Oleiphilus]